MKLFEISKKDPKGDQVLDGVTFKNGMLRYHFYKEDHVIYPEYIDARDITEIVFSQCPNIKNLEGLPEDLLDNIEKFSIDRCSSLENLVGSPMMVGNWINISGCNNLKSLKGIPSSAHDVHISACPSLTEIDDMCSMIGKLYIGACYKIDTLSGIQKLITTMEEFRFDSDRLPKGLLSLLKIEMLEKAEMVISGNTQEYNKAKKAMAIINRYLPEGRILDCQSDLLDAELDEYADL